MKEIYKIISNNHSSICSKWAHYLKDLNGKEETGIRGFWKGFHQSDFSVLCFCQIQTNLCINNIYNKL